MVGLLEGLNRVIWARQLPRSDLLLLKDTHTDKANCNTLGGGSDVEPLGSLARRSSPPGNYLCTKPVPHKIMDIWKSGDHVE